MVEVWRALNHCVTRSQGRGVEGVDRLFGCARVGAMQTSVLGTNHLANRLYLTSIDIHACRGARFVWASELDVRSKVYLPFDVCHR